MTGGKGGWNEGKEGYRMNGRTTGKEERRQKVSKERAYDWSTVA